jgi:peptidoglycan/LPS O-acetylase OafA/YrhL
MTGTDEDTRRSDGSTHSLGYHPALDGLRGISILLVMLYHLQVIVSYYSAKRDFGFVRHIALPSGFLGVDVFFVLSGFLITSILLREWRARQLIDLRRFYARRALRLFPALAFYLLGAYLVTHVLVKNPGVLPVSAILAAAFYVYNWRIALTGERTLIDHTWSLSMEEQYYLVWPLLLLLLLRAGLSARALQWVLGLAVLGIAANRFHLTHLPAGASIDLRCYFATDTRADALLVGSFFAVQADSGGRQAPWARLALGEAGIAIMGLLLVTMSVSQPLLYQAGFTAFAIASGWVVSLAYASPPRVARRALEWPPLVWLGKVSYSLYLWHMTWFLFVTELAIRLQVSVPLQLLLMVAASLGFTVFSYYVVERPFLRRKQGFAPQPYPPAAAERPVSSLPRPQENSVTSRTSIVP